MNKKISNIIGSFLMYLIGFLIGMGGATILYIESAASLTCNYAKGCKMRSCQIDCTLKKQWGGFFTVNKTPINGFKTISTRSFYQEALNTDDNDTYSYGLVAIHAQGETELTPKGGDMHHFPSHDTIVEKTNAYTNAGPSNNVLYIWQVNWVMLLIGYSLLLIWPLQILNIFLTIRKKIMKQ